MNLTSVSITIAIVLVSTFENDSRLHADDLRNCPLTLAAIAEAYEGMTKTELANSNSELSVISGVLGLSPDNVPDEVRSDELLCMGYAISGKGEQVLHLIRKSEQSIQQGLLWIAIHHAAFSHNQELVKMLLAKTDPALHSRALEKTYLNAVCQGDDVALKLMVDVTTEEQRQVWTAKRAGAIQNWKPIKVLFRKCGFKWLNSFWQSGIPKAGTEMGELLNRILDGAKVNPELLAEAYASEEFFWIWALHASTSKQEAELRELLNDSTLSSRKFCAILAGLFSENQASNLKLIANFEGQRRNDAIMCLSRQMSFRSTDSEIVEVANQLIDRNERRRFLFGIVENRFYFVVELQVALAEENTKQP